MILVIRALIFALTSHRGQKRKYTGQPYIVHPIAVAWTVAQVEGSTAAMVAAALLHDVVEDCNVSCDAIQRKFGVEVATLVYWLSDVSKHKDGNRAARKKIDREHLARASKEAQTIKVADLLDNTKSITKYDKDFAVVYMKEKNLLLDVLTKADKSLLELARDELKDYYMDKLTNT